MKSVIYNNYHVPSGIEFDRSLVEKLSGTGPRYTSYPTADRFSDSFSESDYIHALEQRNIGALYTPLSLYIHIPFCQTVCYYCGCNKIVTKDKTQADEYIDYLVKEINLVTGIIGTKDSVRQLHLGGGTPTFLNESQLDRLAQALERNFQFAKNGEYSIEVDPRSVDEQKIAHLGALGLNRISIGVQDFRSDVQTAINRIQSFEETKAIINAAKQNGFRSVSIDLIYGLPHQNSDNFQQTIEQVLQLNPDRIALYNYAHLPHIFKPQRRIDEATLPISAEKLDILQNSVQQLTDNGYLFVGMDHFAKPTDDLGVALTQGRLHRNFQGYSTHADCDLIGLGVSSIGKIGANFAQNDKTLETYYQKIGSGHFATSRGFKLSKDDLLRKGIIQAIMCQFSVCFDVFNELYQINFQQYFKKEMAALKQLEQMELVSIDRHSIMVLPKGRFLVRNIAMQFDYYLQNSETMATYSKTI